jgi:hypothetical protein
MLGEVPRHTAYLSKLRPPQQRARGLDLAKGTCNR